MISGAISHTDFEARIARKMLTPQGVSPIGRDDGPSLVVKGDQPARTVARYRNGLAKAEIILASDALHFLRETRRPLVWLVLEAHDEGEHSARWLADRLKNDVGQIQRRFGAPRYVVELLEGACAVHSNLILPVPRGLAARSLIERVARSGVYGDHAKGQLVRDVDGLMGYLSKEATPEAHFAFGYQFRREKGSHPLGDGGGDRVRLSRDLEHDMLAAGKMQPRTRTYRKRGLVQAPEPIRRPVEVVEPASGVVPDPVQLPLFPHIERRAIRLRDLAHGRAPITAAQEMRVRRLRAGWTQAALAERIGVSRSHLVNFERGRFGLSGQAVARLRELMAAA